MQALKFPIIVSGKVTAKKLHRGQIEFKKDVTLGILHIGHHKYPWAPKSPVNLWIEGRIIIKGMQSHIIGQGSIITVSKNATLEIGDRFSCAPNLKLTVTNKVEIGDNNMWSYDNIILDSDIHVITDMNGNKLNQIGEVRFGDNVWMGARCTVLKNVDISHDVIIGSSTVVTKSLKDPYSVYVGPTALKVKSGIKWKRDFLN